METLTVKEVLSELEKIKKLVVIVLSDLQRKTLIGEINHPVAPAEKKPRKKRTRKVKATEFPPPPPPLLPDADKGNTFYGKPKKKKEKKDAEVE
jgi:hypothetical protein